MLILPDTNIIISFFLRIEPAASLVKKAIASRRILFSIVSTGEFLIKASPKENQIMNKILDEFGVVEINREIMNQAVIYRKYTEKKTKKVYLLDCFIAASAKIKQATLITENTGDYPFIDIQVLSPKELVQNQN